jgi:Cof subfamily protein (haloacid dehalogenase superfamily)
MVYNDKNEIIYERLLDNDVIIKVENFCDEFDLGLIAYCGERIIAKKTSSKTNFIEKYKEPIPEEYPAGLGQLQSNGIKVHKLILLDNDDILIKIRPELEKQIGAIASTTKAVPGMLEVLPLNASKGYGVQKLLEYYNIDAKNTIAFGDGENDIEMLKLVEIGAAVNNAKAMLKSIANIIIDSNDNEGVATVIEALTELRTSK